MRADRLLSIMMLLQGRGRMTAGQLSAELEVSERTIYRDVDALSVAGIPVYGERGPEGGYALLDSYRTRLTGLTENEVRALFMLSIPAPFAELGVDDELRAAMRKLSAALPDRSRGAEAQVRQRVHVDSVWWAQGDDPVPHLRALHDAVWQDRVVRIRYRQPFGTPAVLERAVDPYGLVVKAGAWYLVYARQGRLRVIRVSHLQDVELTPATFERDPELDLSAFWRAWCAEGERQRTDYRAVVRVAPELLEWLPHYFGERIRAAIGEAGPPDGEGWIRLELGFESLPAARERILGFGRAMEVLEPRALRLSVADFARQVVQLYGEG
jgi:predicted DNA-binding transcriptional regulator YafY